MFFQAISPMGFRWLFFGGAIMLSLLACDAAEPIRVGVLLRTTGRAADIGISARDAIQLAAAQCNQQGGIHGRRVELVIRDNFQNADAALKAVKALDTAGVTAVIGPMNSSIAMAIVPHVNRAQLLTVGGTVTTPHLSGLDDYFFRVCITAREHAHRSADYQIRSGDMRRITVAYDNGNRTFCEDWLAIFKKTFVAGGGRILATIVFDAEDKRSFSRIAEKLLTAGPDGILIIANPMDSAMLCQQIRKSDPAVKITLSNWGATQRLLELGGKSVEGATMPIAFDWESTSPAYRAFRKQFFERYQREPGFAGFYAYDAAQVVLTALNARKAGQSLKATLLAIGEFEGLQGKISFDAYGDLLPSTASMRIVRHQKFTAAE